MNDQTHPTGTVQGIATTSIGMLALIVAFVGYTSFSGTSGTKPWHWSNGISLLLAATAMFYCLRAPYLATMPGSPDAIFESTEKARRCVKVSAISTFLAITFFIGVDFFFS